MEETMMRIKTLKTKGGSLTHCSFVTDDNGNHYCFSYDQLVAAIIDGKYIEYDGDMFYSQTSRRHKAAFRREYSVEKGA